MQLFLGEINENSFIHRLDPRIKLLWLMGNLSFVLFLQESRILLFSLVLVFFTNKLAGIPFRRLNILIKILLVLGIQIIILQALLYHHGAVVGKFLGLKVYMGGILLGIHSFLILVNLAMFSLQFTMWTSPEDLTLLLTKFHLPSRYAVLVGLALRFLPIMEKDLAAIYESQQSRGLELNTFFQKVKGLMPIMLPLILRALKRGNEVALSMELKGYTFHDQRTFLRSIAFSKLDYCAGVIICSYFGLVLYLI
ncbi:MAG: energy-coupling factor transporter transmembrane component T family protein [Bacillota bacterium]|jgi:energy-coupling factor transport system permease protein|nr:energy-coupling factor transporter transmembrane protein EcfT [Clostridia bacterium]